LRMGTPSAASISTFVIRSQAFLIAGANAPAPDVLETDARTISALSNLIALQSILRRWTFVHWVICSLGFVHLAGLKAPRYINIENALDEKMTKRFVHRDSTTDQMTR